MKKLTFIAGLVLLMSTSSYAEDDYASPFAIYAGANIGASIYSNNVSGTAFSSGIDFGIQTNNNWTLGAFVTFLDSIGGTSISAFGLEPNLLFNKSTSYFRLGARVGAISFGTTEFLVGPVVGFGVNLNDKTILDFSLGFETSSNVSRFDPRIGVRFLF